MTRSIIERAGEAGRFEFKATVDAVSPRVLVAAANACLIEGIPDVTILVGVSEREDRATGAVTGHVTGLPNLERAKGALRSRASVTRPVPVAMTLYEENLAHRPILRLSVSPTHPPHYDDEGRRVTRSGAMTRALTDEELVAIYLDREAESFQLRFREIAEEMDVRLANLAQSVDFNATTLEDQMDRVRTLLKEVDASLTSIHELADQAAGASAEGFDYLSALDDSLGEIRRLIQAGYSEADSFEEVWLGVRQGRADAALRLSLWSDWTKDPAKEASAILRGLMDRTIDPIDYERNISELNAWKRVPDPTEKLTAADWVQFLASVQNAIDRPVGPPLSARLDHIKNLLIDHRRAMQLVEEASPPKRRRRTKRT